MCKLIITKSQQAEQNINHVNDCQNVAYSYLKSKYAEFYCGYFTDYVSPTETKPYPDSEVRGPKMGPIWGR